MISSMASCKSIYKPCVSRDRYSMKNVVILVMVLFSYLITACASSSKDISTSTATGLEKLKSGNAAEAKEIFEKQCQNKDSASCIQLGFLADKENQKLEAETMFNQACELGSTYSCYLTGIKHFSKSDFSKAQSFFEKSCGDFAEACVSLAVTHANLGHYDESNKLLEDLCTKNVARACTFLGKNFEHKSQFEKALVAYAKGCSLKLQTACAFQANLELLVGDPAKGLSLARQDCSNGGAQTCRITDLFNKVQKDPRLPRKLKAECESNKKESCYSLGLYQSLHLKTFASGKQILKKSCDLGSGVGCTELANFVLNATNRKEWIRLLKLACKNGAGRSCTILAEDASESDLDQPREELIKKGCELHDGAACISISVNDNDEKNRLSLYKKACKSKNLEGCYWEKINTVKKSEELAEIKSLCDKNLSLACQRAGMIEKDKKNMAAAKIYFQKACELNDIISCKEAVMTLDDPKLGLAEVCSYGDSMACLKAGKMHYESKDLKSAKVLFGSGCGQFEGLSCNFLALILLKENDLVGGQNFLHKSCDLGSALACETIAKKNYDLLTL